MNFNRRHSVGGGANARRVTIRSQLIVGAGAKIVYCCNCGTEISV